jgi:hypothetical protein
MTMINVSGAFHENYEPLLQQNLPEAATSKSWSRQQAYGWTAAPRYVVRDRDAVYGDIFLRRLQAMGIS